jgi:hypothetical protein
VLYPPQQYQGPPGQQYQTQQGYQIRQY